MASSSTNTSSSSSSSSKIKLFGNTIIISQNLHFPHGNGDGQEERFSTFSMDHPARRTSFGSLHVNPTLLVKVNQEEEEEGPRLEPVACPRCGSMVTKFCYFNNYNVNQPRHYCRGCHRYWTAGGSLRNVPVGSGRRRRQSKDPPDQQPLPFPFNAFNLNSELGEKKMEDMFRT